MSEHIGVLHLLFLGHCMSEGLFLQEKKRERSPTSPDEVGEQKKKKKDKGAEGDSAVKSEKKKKKEKAAEGGESEKKKKKKKVKEDA